MRVVPFAACLLAAALLGCSSSVEPNLDRLRAIEVSLPIDTAAEAAAAAVKQIEMMERSLGRSISPTRITYVGQTQFGTAAEENLLVNAPFEMFEHGQWFVRAEGTFVTWRGKAPGPRFAGSGHFVFSTSDGILEMGFP